MGRVGDQGIDVDALAGRPKPLEEALTRRELGLGAVVVAALEMEQPHADEQDALVKIAYVVALVSPQDLQGFVLFEVFAAIKLLDAVPEKLRRGVAAARRVKRAVTPTGGRQASLRTNATVGRRGD